MSNFKYFGYDPNSGFELFETEEQAKNYAEEAISYYRGDACDGWSEEVDQVCWGELKQETVQVGLRPRNEEDGHNLEMTCDYVLTDIK